MAFSLFSVVAIFWIQISSAEDCDIELSTESLVRHIRHTGNTCNWTVIAPVSQRIVLTLQEFTIQTESNRCSTYLEIYDEHSSAGRICQNTVGWSNYISHGNRLHLNVTNESEVPAIITVEASFQAAAEYFSCDFSQSSDCTRSIQQTSTWEYTTDGNGICGRGRPALISGSGFFYQIALSSTSLQIPGSLSPGDYILDANVSAGCSPPDFTQTISLNFCNRTKHYPLRDFYGRWATGTDLIQCDHESEVLIQATPGRMVVAMDNIRLMKLIEEIPGEATTPSSSSSSTFSLVTFEQNNSSAFQLAPLLVVIGSIALLSTIVAVVVCILCKRRTKTVRDSEANGRVHFENSSYDRTIPAVPDTNRPPEYEAIDKSYIGVSMISNLTYQPASGSSITGAYNYIDTHSNHDNESGAVKDYECPHQFSEDKDHTYSDVQDHGTYGSPENDYQMA